jgi:hypothetical protein
MNTLNADGEIQTAPSSYLQDEQIQLTFQAGQTTIAFGSITLTEAEFKAVQQDFKSLTKQLLDNQKLNARTAEAVLMTLLHLLRKVPTVIDSD